MPSRRPLSVQADLFGGPSAPPALAAAPITDDLSALGANLDTRLRLGTSSWTFPGWAGIVYDRSASATALTRDGLAAYARHPLLRAVGLDRTYYAPIDADEFARLAAQVPSDFRFLVKAHAALTNPWGHLADRLGLSAGRRVVLDAAWARDVVVAPAVEGLGDRLGTILFQFPPLALPTRRLIRLCEALGRFLEALPPGPRYAVEVRNAELVQSPLADAYAAALARGGAAHCATVHPRMPGVQAQHAVLGRPARPPGLVPIRWMLRADRAYEEAREEFAPFNRLAAPDPTVRVDVAALIQSLLADGHEVLLVANNKAEGSAPLTLIELARAVVARQPRASGAARPADQAGTSVTTGQL